MRYSENRGAAEFTFLKIQCLSNFPYSLKHGGLSPYLGFGINVNLVENLRLKEASAV